MSNDLDDLFDASESPDESELDSMFDALGPAPVKQQAITEDTSSFMGDFMSAGQNVLGSQAIGIAQGIAGIKEYLGLGDPAERKLLDKAGKMARQDMTKIKKRSPVAGNLGAFAGELAPFLATAGLGGAAAKLAGGAIGKGVLGGAAATAPVAATRFVPEGESRLKGAAVETAIGAGAGGALAGLGKAVGAARSAIAEAKPGRIATRAIQEADQPAIQASQEAAERLGVKLSPAEAARSPIAAAKESQLPISTEAQTGLQRALSARERQIKPVMDRVLKSIVPEGDEKLRDTVNKLYNSIDDIEVPEEVVTSLQQSKIINQALSKVENNPAFQELMESGALKSNVSKFDLVKRALDDKISLLHNAGKSAEAKGVEKARTRLLKELDEVSPQYKQARQEAERLIMNNDLAKELAKAKSEELGDISSKTFFKSFLETPAKREKLDKLLKNATAEIRQNVKDLSVILRGMNVGRLDSLASKAVKGATRLEGTRGGSARAIEMVKDIVVGKRDDEVIKLLTNGEWSNVLQKVRQMPKSQQPGALMYLLDTVRFGAAPAATSKNAE